MPLLGEAALPAGLRVYAIGDVHGCLDRLAALHAAIGEDLERHPVDDVRLVHCGDYVDRGPDSAGVIALLAARSAEDPRVICLRGNHEEYFEGFCDDPERWGPSWMRNGGIETLQSYGIASGKIRPGGDLSALARAFNAGCPQAHRDFVARCAYMVRFGDFAFVHAGIRPGIPLEDQDEHDLTWIREPFHSDDRDHGAVIVHGHTPVEAPDVRANRINIDTGAVYGGPLTCVVIEGTGIRFLSA